MSCVPFVYPLFRRGPVNVAVIPLRERLIALEYEPELDFDLLQLWCDYHQGKAVDNSNFYTILMGAFLGGLTPEVTAFLRQFSQFYDNSLFDNLCRICDAAKLDDDVVSWVTADLTARRPLFETQPDGKPLINLIDRQLFRFAETREEYYDVLNSSVNHSTAYHAVSDYALEHVHEKNLSRLVEPLYHICNSYALVFGILAPMLNAKIDLSNYFEIYLRGADYVFDSDAVLIIRHTNVG